MGTYNELFRFNSRDIALIEYAGPNQRRLASAAGSECPGRTRRKRGECRIIKLASGKMPTGQSGLSKMNHVELAKLIEDVKSRSLPNREALASVATVLSAFVSDPANQPMTLPAMTCGLYTRILLSSVESDFQIVVVFWGPHSKSPIHDHSATVGAVACLKGVTEETKYQVARTDGSKAYLKALDTLRLTEGVVTAILPDDERQLHDMVNSTSEWAATIHVYLTPIHYFHIYEPLPDGSFRMHPTELWFDEHGASHLWTRGDRAHA